MSGEKLTSNRSAGRAVLLYTAAFTAFFFLCIFIYNLIWGRNLFTYGDGLMQQYPYFLYSGKWMRKLAGNIFVRHTFEIPMWDMTLVGFDPILTFGQMILDPVNWLSAFIPVKYGEAAFDFAIALKFYLSGLSFLYFCRYRKKEGTGTILGSMIYVFSGITFIGLFQANFLNLFYLFPLLMAGVLKLWEEKKFVHYTVVLALCTLYDFYFTFMMGIIVIIYCIIRFIFREKGDLKSLLPLVGRFILFSVIGIGIGIGPSVPSMVNMAQMDRLSLTRPFELIYIRDRSKAVIGGLFSFAYLRFESHIGISACVIPAVWCLFREKKKDTDLKILLAVYYLSFFLPVVGSLFNGGNYASHRYIFGFVFLLAYIFVLKFPDILKTAAGSWRAMLVICIVYIVPCVLADELYGFTSAISAVISVYVMWTISCSKKLTEEKKMKLMMIPVLISCMLIGVTYALIRTESLSVEFGKANYYLYDSEGKDILRALPDSSQKRSDRLMNSDISYTSNSSMLTGVMGFDFYHSYYAPGIKQYMDDMGLISDSVAFSYRNLHGRGLLEIQNGMSYLLIPDGYYIKTPAGYSADPSLGSSEGYRIYTPDAPVSIAYFYDEKMSYDTFSKLDPAYREELMMTHVVTGAEDDGEAVFLTDQIPYEITETAGLTVKDGVLKVDESKAYMTLSFDPVTDSEILLDIKGFDMDTTKDHDTRWAYISVGLSGEDGLKMKDGFNSTTANVGVYNPKEHLVFNFNPCEEPVTSVKIIFDQKGEYSLEDIKLFVRSSSDIEKLISGFEEHADTDDADITFEGNSIHIETQREKDGILYIAVPYSEGWSAKVDGRDAVILKANDAFMAIGLEGGHHEIEMRYVTPYLATGMLITLVSAAALAVCAVVFKKRYNS